MTKNVPLTVTYHDPCRLGRLGEPYIRWEEMTRIKEYAWCCGAGGGVAESNPEFSAWTANERIGEAVSTGAEAIVTACPWCEKNFTDAVKGNNGSLKVYDIVELVEKAL